jgi:Zn-dependent protease with chaperone function
VYALFVYRFDLKVLLAGIPHLAGSSLLYSLAGIMPFAGLLLIVWTCAHTSYQRFYHPGISRRAYLFSHIKINAAVVLPWLIVSLILEIAALIAGDFTQAMGKYPLASFLVFAAFLGVTAIFFPVLLVRLWDCTPIPDGYLRTRLEAFCRRNHFAYRDILLWNLFDGRLITAGVIGFVKRFRYILISPVLLQILDEEEVESVVAHEIGHVKNHHMIYYAFFLLGYVVVAYGVLELVTYEMLAQDIVVAMVVSGATDVNSIVSLLLTLVPLGFFIIYFRIFFGYFSRNFERQSDLHALRIMGSGDGIINALEKIAQVSSQNRNAPNWHHFGIAERIGFLQRCEESPALISRHDRKIARMVSGAALLLVVCGALMYTADSKLVDRAKLKFSRKILEQQAAKQPDNPTYHFTLGNIYYEEGNLKKAEAQFKRALDLNPEDPEILNNLAWLYATADVEELRKPAEALRLSQKAARISPKPHILDTLGESYFVNGRYEEAVRALEAAVSAGTDNPAYYAEQLKKFKQYRDGERVDSSSEIETVQKYEI